MKDKSILTDFFFIIALLLLLPLISYTQELENGFLRVTGIVKDDKSILANATIKAIENNITTHSTQTDQKGKFEVKLDLSKDYTLEISKEGYLTSNYKIDTKTSKEYHKYWVFNFNITTVLVPQIEGLDQSFFSGRDINISFNNSFEKFTADRDKNRGVFKKNRELLAKAKEIKKKTGKYNEFIAMAEASFQQENYEEAMNYYEKASQLLNFKQFPKDKIIEIKEILDRMNNPGKYYDAYITKADSAFYQQDYEYAKENYLEASKIIPSKDYPKQQIQKIGLIIEEIAEKQEKYNKTIALADNQFSSENYLGAKDSYLGASAIMPEKEYPKNQVNKIDSILNKEQIAEVEEKNALAQNTTTPLYKKNNINGQNIKNEVKTATNKTNLNQSIENKPKRKNKIAKTPNSNISNNTKARNNKKLPSNIAYFKVQVGAYEKITSLKKFLSHFSFGDNQLVIEKHGELYKYLIDKTFYIRGQENSNLDYTLSEAALLQEQCMNEYGIYDAFINAYDETGNRLAIIIDAEKEYFYVFP